MSNFKQYLRESINQLLNEEPRNFDQSVINDILAAWNQQLMRGGTDFPYELDYNGDGIIDGADLRWVMDHWGDPYYAADTPPEGGGGHRGYGGEIAPQATAAFDPRYAGVKNGVSPASR